MEQSIDGRIFLNSPLDKECVENMDWINLAQVEVGRGTFVNTVMELQLP